MALCPHCQHALPDTPRDHCPNCGGDLRATIPPTVTTPALPPPPHVLPPPPAGAEPDAAGHALGGPGPSRLPRRARRDDPAGADGAGGVLPVHAHGRRHRRAALVRGPDRLDRPLGRRPSTGRSSSRSWARAWRGPRASGRSSARCSRSCRAGPASRPGRLRRGLRRHRPLRGCRRSSTWCCCSSGARGGDFEASLRVVSATPRRRASCCSCPSAGSSSPGSGRSCSTSSASPRPTGSATARRRRRCCCRSCSCAAAARRFGLLVRGRARGPRRPDPVRPAGLRSRWATPPAVAAGRRSGAIFGGIGLVAAGAVALLHLDRLPLTLCVFKGLTGLPCPTCGSTRALGRLFALDFAAALAMNPFTTLAAVVVAAWAARRPRAAAGPPVARRRGRRPGSRRVLRVAGAGPLPRELGLPDAPPAADGRAGPVAYTQVRMDGDARPHVSVVVPLYNEADNVADLHRRAHRRPRDDGPALRAGPRRRRQHRRHPPRRCSSSRPSTRACGAVLLRRNFGQTAAFSAGFDRCAGRRSWSPRTATCRTTPPTSRRWWRSSRRRTSTWSAAGAGGGRTRSRSGSRPSSPTA